MVTEDRSRWWRLWRLVRHRRLLAHPKTTQCWRCGYHYAPVHKEN